MDKIIVKGARENNLKNVNISLPKNKLIVMTGVSGSGKSSLAFDTIFAEGQRRYVESLSAYARQFIGGTEKPDVDSIEGLSPSISIDQKIKILVRQWEQLLKYMIICVFYLLELALLIVRFIKFLLKVSLLRK